MRRLAGAHVRTEDGDSLAATTTRLDPARYHVAFWSPANSGRR